MLAELYAGSIADAAQRAEITSLSQLEKFALAQPAALDPITPMRNSDYVRVIAEIKRASPSKGHLADIPDPGKLAQEYEFAGASAISVLTEQRQFLGSLEDLEVVRRVTTLPLLRKDFIANEYQVMEARALGADIVLLIVAGLEPAVLKRLKLFVEELGMTAFVETHNRAELELAAEIEAQLIGINARDLSTFETDRDLFASLAQSLPADCVKVAESAVRNRQDVEAYAAAGADAVLVGEALVRGNPSELIGSFVAVSKV